MSLVHACTVRGRTADRRDGGLGDDRAALALMQPLRPDGVHRTIVRTCRALAQAAREAGDEQTAAEYEARGRAVKATLEE